jgi:hypothetical protein
MECKAIILCLPAFPVSRYTIASAMERYSSAACTETQSPLPTPVGGYPPSCPDHGPGVRGLDH